MKQILAFGILMVICAMLGAFLQWIRMEPAYHYGKTVDAYYCSRWVPMDEHKLCKSELCPTVEDEAQMVCR